MTAPVNPEGQAAQEVRHRAEALWIALNRPAMTSNKGIDLIARALAATPSPAKQAEQKIASAEGAALQSGAAPAAFDQFLAHLREHGIDEEGSCILCERWIGRVRDPDHAAAPAQPDARDAKIARLLDERDKAREAMKAEARLHAKHYARANAAENERDEARARLDALVDTLTDDFVRALSAPQAALAPTEPKAETPAETAGQKEGP